MLDLRELGFIESKSSGIREYGFVLLLDPIRVCVQLRHKPRSRVPDEWWHSFVARADAVGAGLAAYIKELKG